MFMKPFQTPHLRRQALSLMMEAGATLPQDIQDQVPAYAQALLRRFDNTELAHRLDQIAMDGSQKLPYRILETLRARAAPVLIARCALGCPIASPELRKVSRWMILWQTEIAKAANSAQPERMLLTADWRRRLSAAHFGIIAPRYCTTRAASACPACSAAAWPLPDKSAPKYPPLKAVARSGRVQNFCHRFVLRVNRLPEG